MKEEKKVWREIRGDLYILLINQYKFFDLTYKLKTADYKQTNEIFGRKLELWIPIETVLRSVFVEEDELASSKKRFLSRYEFASYQTSEIEVAVIETIISEMGDKTEIILRPKEIAQKIDTELFSRR